MGLNFKLIQRTAKTSTSDVVHSSGYASVNNGLRFGASDNTTFSERQQIEHSRKMVQGYRNARVAQGVNRMPKAQTYEQEMAMKAAMAAIAAGERDAGVSKKQEFNNRLERGGMQKYDFNARQNGTINRTAQVGGQLSNRQMAAQARAARAERFDAPARPIPKTGGFGRH